MAGACRHARHPPPAPTSATPPTLTLIVVHPVVFLTLLCQPTSLTVFLHFVRDEPLVALGRTRQRPGLPDCDLYGDAAAAAC
ncbi:hypothetical protein GW17_00031852 [Ensete ventricosum]|nr:hypothetical protein GW17_00031852 [Ensete ventricosum]